MHARLPMSLLRCCVVALVGALCLLLSGCGGSGGAADAPHVARIVSRSPENGLILTPGATATVTVAVDGDPPTRSHGPLRLRLTAPRDGASATFVTPAPDGDHVFVGDASAAAPLTVQVRSNGVPGPFLIGVEVDGDAGGLIGSVALANVAAAPDTPLLSGQAARERVERDIVRGDLAPILHGPVYLAPGTTVTSFVPDPPGPPTRSRPTRTRQVPGPTWLFWLDTERNAAFSHPTRFLTIAADAANAPTVASDEVWWPIVTTPGGPDAADLVPGTWSASDDEADEGDAGRFGRQASTAPDDACAILVRGPRRPGGASDLANIRDWLVRSNRVKPAHIDMPEALISPDGLYRRLAQAREDGCKKVYVFIVAHGWEFGVALAGRDLLYGEFAERCRGFDEVCVTVSACESGGAYSAFNNLGINGSVAAAARVGKYAFSDWFDASDLYLENWVRCADELAVSLGRQPTWAEIQACVRQGPGFPELYDGYWLARAETPAAHAIVNGQTPSAYALPVVAVVKAGQNVVVTLPRPPQANPVGDVYIRMRFTIADPSIATFAGGKATLDVTWGYSETEKEVTIHGVADGETRWSMTGRTSNGFLLEGAAQTVRVGSSYRFSPETIDMLVGERREIALYRFGALPLGSYASIVTLGSQNATVAQMEEGSAVFEFDRILHLVHVKTGFQVGTTTITATDTPNGLSAPLTVRVHQEVVLDRDLTAPNGIVFKKGAAISTARMTGWRIAGPDHCPDWHMHSDGPGITIDGHGPIPDPNPTDCGYGRVIQPP